MRLRDERTAQLRAAEPWRFTRRGVPNGMRKWQSDPLWAEARELADRFIQIMKDKGELTDEIVEVTVRDEHGDAVDSVPVAVPASDTGKAEAALREAFVMAVGPSTQNIKIQAINTVLAYTKSKPESKTKLTVDPLAFLDEVAKDAN
jgi:hypothetical protein